MNRFYDYTRQVRALVRARRFDAFHICDHSYAQLVHALPSERTGVYCHDLDTFQCLLDPQRDPRPIWFRAMARRILRGLQRAAVVFYSTDAVRAQIESHGLLDPSRLVHAPLGVAPEFLADGSRDDLVLAAVKNAAVGFDIGDLFEPRTSARRSSETSAAERKSAAHSEIRWTDDQTRGFVLHVGSCIPRKRIDVLLEAFARLRTSEDRIRLVQAGGVFTAEQRARIDRLGLRGSILQLNNLPREAIAALYRRARLVVVSSDAEGFGLPVIESLACGTPVVASDLAALREAGGEAMAGVIDYAEPGNAAAFARAALTMMQPADDATIIEARTSRAARFSWTAHGSIIAATYRKLVSAIGPSVSSDARTIEAV